MSGGIFRVVLAVGLLAILAGCSSAQVASHGLKRVTNAHPPPSSIQREGRYKVGNPYQINGIWYYPAENARYDEVGIASWYGRAFHGRRTANGAIYDMYALTAAHKTLPMPSKVRVTNLENGRSMVLVVNDRGPFVNGRIIDLSWRAAKILGFSNSGLATVRVQALSPENGLQYAHKPSTSLAEANLPSAAPRTAVDVQALHAPEGVRVAAAVLPPRPRVPEPRVGSGRFSTKLFVQVAAFEVAANATRFAHDLTPFGKVRIVAVETDATALYRVQLGPIEGTVAADAALQKLLGAGYQDARLVVD